MTSKKQAKKALVLFSGGLDSILTAKILQDQGIKVTAVIYKSFFWETDKAEIMAKKNKILYFVENISDKHLAIVKNPKHGYGKAANPCLDCHALMLKEAKLHLHPPRRNAFAHPRSDHEVYLENITCEVAGRSETKAMTPRRGKMGVFDFIATGEVLGQRPFSQTKKALQVITEESGLGDRLLRPLSARLLPKTLPEKKGWVNPEKLYDIQGRSRRRQISLAKKYGIKDYPQPAGGCRLTEMNSPKNYLIC